MIDEEQKNWRFRASKSSATFAVWQQGHTHALLCCICTYAYASIAGSGTGMTSRENTSNFRYPPRSSFRDASSSMVSGRYSRTDARFETFPPYTTLYSASALSFVNTNPGSEAATSPRASIINAHMYSLSLC